MAKAKKFGTFSGVFTPSILTILGVIMYLRFPSIIGQAGLINTIGIIVIAHIISITTSLSVASLSTDKPVQTGGTYFMISRSLGLPIGGTLGFALFVGLSFSVSLYLIGFAESFLQYWGFDNTINTIRLTGTIVLVAVTTITFISTSLAIKSQYFIMAAIGLSLLSIFFGNHEFAPTEINMAPLANAAPFMILFGIFFPAVTGFEAGVSMSGDLKNPKKSLPAGAMLAVGIGFVVYIGLALFYAFNVDANALANDPQILFKISLVPALVIAGIWGATLSSALGSILGAPRILQAIAMDKIAPKVFAKGTGKTNEPRNALLLAFVIAEAGILIGELDVIARIVSMFFITTYAFLNLASAIESWSSSDFRPAFKIPKFVSILGTLSAFIVMILLDFLALAGATIVLGLLYFYLQRKELILESGDAWSSFWTNLAKRALLKLSIQKADKRNWRPNIILFSGGEQARPHLVEIGLSLTGKLGSLTDFDLVSGQESSKILTSTSDKKKNKNPNYFVRQFACDTVESGIKAVTSVYGFSGFEPNTILMGWSRNTKNVNFLVNVLKELKSKDLNAVFLDYDKKTGFGKKENIDIWWNGKGRHLSFTLHILKFLLSDPSWRDAEIRILIINNDTSITDAIYRNTAALLNEKRIKAEIRIINNDFGTRTKESIINAESAHADLIVLGLSQKNNAYTQEYINRINNISELPSTLLLLRPSNEFEEINLIEPYGQRDTAQPFVFEAIDLQPLPEIENKVVKSRLDKLDADCLKIGSLFIDKTVHEVIKYEQSLLRNISDFTKKNQLTLEREVDELDPYELVKTIVRNHQLFLRNINLIIKNQNREFIREAETVLTNGISALITRLGNYIYESPESILVTYSISAKKREKSYKARYQKLLAYYLNTELLPEVHSQLNILEEVSVKLFTELRKIIFGINDDYEKQLINAKAEKDSYLTTQKYMNEFDKLEQFLNNYEKQSKSSILNSFRKIVILLAEDLSTPLNIKRSKKKTKRTQNIFSEYFNSFADNWGGGIDLINNTLYLDTLILSEQKIANNLIQKGNERIRAQVNEKLFVPIDKLIKNIENSYNLANSDIKPPAFPEELQIQKIFKDSYYKVSEVIDELPEEIILPDFVYKDSTPVSLSEYTPAIANINKSGIYYLDTLFYEPFYREVEQLEKIANTAIIECKEANSMLLFHLSNIQPNDQGQEMNKSMETGFYNKLMNQVNKEKEKLETALHNIEHSAMVFMQEAFSNLFYHTIQESEKKISAQRREQQSRKFSIGISKRMNILKAKLNNLITLLINSSSSGIILSKKYLSETMEPEAQTGHILDLVEELLPHKEVYNHVPVFYRSLMSSGSKINDEFWVSREEELHHIKNALYRHKNGLGGAVLIKGVHGAGKTALSRYAAYHLFKKNNVFWINAPINGSTNVEDFLNSIRKQVVRLDDFTGIFSNLPFESVVVINNLELWWERSANGLSVLQKIIELIEIYGKKVFFILNCNTYSYNIIKKLIPIEDNFISIVECGKFNTSQLQHLIMSRHKSSGLTLKYKGKSEENLSQLSLSFLFNAYFSFSEGVPGLALNAWKASIIKAGTDSITITKPARPNVDILNNMDPDWLIVIALFIQHKNIDVDKLSRITGYDSLATEKLINHLLNSGVIVPKANSTYTLGRNIEPFLVEICANKGII